MSNTFTFYTRYYLVRILGRRARNPEQLLKGIREVPESSIYYHTHRFLQQHHYMSPEPPNDFAYWATTILNISELGETLASVDTVSYNKLEGLREAYIEKLENYLSEDNFSTNCKPGQEFQFASCVSFVAPTPYIASNLREFSSILGHVSVSSLYFHFFESKLRLNRNENDFSLWLKDLGEVELSEEIAKIDPYTITLEGLRNKIISLVRSRYARNQ